MKKNVIRVICLLMALCMCFGLVSCAGFGSSNSASAPESGESGANSEGGATLTPPAPPIDYSQGLTGEGFWKDVTALDYVTLPEYKGVAIPQEEITATAEDVQAVKTNLVNPYGTPKKITEGETKDGDTVNIDYVGTVDGVEFTGGNTNKAGANLTLGSGTYIPGFEEQLVGKKPGDTVEVKVTFPSDYRDSTDKDGNPMVLKDKEAIFTTTINYIAGEMEYPAFDDAFVADKLQAKYGWKTVEEADKGIAENLTEGNKYNWLMTYLDENSTVSEIPQTIIDTITNINFEGTKASVGMYGMSLEDFLAGAGFEDEDAFRAELAKEADSTARQHLLFQAVAEAEGIQANDDLLKETFGEELDAMTKQYGEGYVHQIVLINEVSDLLMESN